MKFVTYTHWDQLPESANTLFEQAEKDSLFFSRPWFESLTANGLDDDHTMVLACVIDDNKVLAILPLMESVSSNNSKHTTWYSLRHGFTSLYSLLLSNDEPQEQILSCLAQAIIDLPIDGLLLEPIANDDNNINRLQKLLETAGYKCEHNFRDYNWIYRLHGKSYDEYMANRPAKLRNTIARKKRKLEREHGFEIKLYTGNEVPEHMADYHVVYNASWKQNEINNADYQENLIETFSQAGHSGEGWTRLAILYVKEQPIAAQLWFVHSGKASIFRLAYDKNWRTYSTGSILTSFLMEYVIDTDKVEEIDFLTGNDAYKQDWMSERRERFLLSCVKKRKPESRVERFTKPLKCILKKR